VNVEKKDRVETCVGFLGTAIKTSSTAAGTAVGAELGCPFLGQMAGALAGQAAADRVEPVAREWAEACVQLADDVKSLHQAAVDTMNLIPDTVDLIINEPVLVAATVRRLIGRRRDAGRRVAIQ
jgi:hypothetical protein